MKGLNQKELFIDYRYVIQIETCCFEMIKLFNILYNNAINKTDIKVKTLIGPQTILSGLLGVIKFIIEPKKKNATINHIPISPKRDGWLLIKLVCIKTI